MKICLLASLFALTLAGCASQSKIIPPEEGGYVGYGEENFSPSSGSGYTKEQMAQDEAGHGRSDEEMAAINGGGSAVPPEESGMVAYGEENFSTSSGSGVRANERVPASKAKKKKKAHH